MLPGRVLNGPRSKIQLHKKLVKARDYYYFSHNNGNKICEQQNEVEIENNSKDSISLPCGLTHTKDSCMLSHSATFCVVVVPSVLVVTQRPPVKEASPSNSLRS